MTWVCSIRFADTYIDLLTSSFIWFILSRAWLLGVALLSLFGVKPYNLFIHTKRKRWWIDVVGFIHPRHAMNGWIKWAHRFIFTHYWMWMNKCIHNTKWYGWMKNIIYYQTYLVIFVKLLPWHTGNGNICTKSNSCNS